MPKTSPITMAAEEEINPINVILKSLKPQLNHSFLFSRALCGPQLNHPFRGCLIADRTQLGAAGLNCVRAAIKPLPKNRRRKKLNFMAFSIYPKLARHKKQAELVSIRQRRFNFA